MAKSMTNGGWSRIGDNAFGIGLTRYRDSDDRPLWLFFVTKHPNEKIIEMDATVSDLSAIKRWCDSAITTLLNDGGRIDEDGSEVTSADEGST